MEDDRHGSWLKVQRNRDVFDYVLAFLQIVSILFKQILLDLFPVSLHIHILLEGGTEAPIGNLKFLQVIHLLLRMLV